MQKVEGSNPFIRSSFLLLSPAGGAAFPPGDVAEWLGRGLQNLVQRFDSARRLQLHSPAQTPALIG